MKIAYGFNTYKANGPFPMRFEIIDGQSQNPKVKIFLDQPFEYNNKTTYGSGFFFCCGGKWGANVSRCDSGGFSWSQLSKMSVLDVSSSNQSVTVMLTKDLCPYDLEVGGLPYWFGYAFDNIPFGKTNYEANIYGIYGQISYPASLWRYIYLKIYKSVFFLFMLAIYERHRKTSLYCLLYPY